MIRCLIYNYFIQLKHKKSNYKDISNNAVMEPWHVFDDECSYVFDNRYPHIPFSSYEPNTSLAGVTSARLKAKNTDGAALSHQISAVRLSKLFNIHIEALQDMVNHGSIAPLTQVRIGAQSIFDLKAISKRLELMEVHGALHEKDMISFQQLFKLLPLFNVHFGQVIDSVLIGDLPLYCPGEHKQLAHCFLSKSATLSELHKLMLTNKANVSTQTLAELLIANIGLIVRLEQKNLLMSNHWSKSGEIYGDEFSRFMNKYICINRVCFFTGSEQSKLIQLLLDLNTNFAFNHEFRGTTLALIESTVRNINALKEILSTSTNEHPAYMGFMANPDKSST